MQRGAAGRLGSGTDKALSESALPRVQPSPLIAEQLSSQSQVNIATLHWFRYMHALNLEYPNYPPAATTVRPSVGTDPT